MSPEGTGALSDDAAPAPLGSRIQLAHHQIRLDDGRRVGLSVGGRGVPLVFFHGIGMHRRMYLKLLSRLPQFGFLVIAIDAPGHGETFAPRQGEDSFNHRMDVTERILDTLGVERAVLVGHSMGGRTATELAGRQPDRALAVILIDPAVGGVFDGARARIASPVKTGLALAAALGDTLRDRVGLRRLDHVRYMQTLSKLAVQTAAHRASFSSAASAIAYAEVSATALQRLRDAGSCVVVIHGEKDVIVPIESAFDAAAISGAQLITLPQAYHSWILTTPWTFTEILAQLIAERRLSTDLHLALADASEDGRHGVALRKMYSPDASVLELTPPIRVLGRAHPRKRNLYHTFRVRIPDEVFFRPRTRL
jgi:pimeloyl-ACP methyl ester carboxylesterase